MDHLTNKKIGFIGGGQMAEAVFGGMLRLKAAASDIFVTDISEARLAGIKARFAVNTILNTARHEGSAAIAETCDIIVLAVKPQYAKSVLEGAGKLFDKKRHLVISIIGGMTLESLERYIKAPVVRVMPNLPMTAGEGAAGIALGTNCMAEHGETAKEIFDLAGISYILPESLIDPLTGVSGCGPAYAFMFMEALADGGVETGLPRDIALKLAAQTLLGSAKMVLEGGHPGTLKDHVCSPGGATIAGVHALESGAFRGAVMDAVRAGMRRMAEIGKKL